MTTPEILNKKINEGDQVFTIYKITNTDTNEVYINYVDITETLKYKHMRHPISLIENYYKEEARQYKHLLMNISIKSLDRSILSHGFGSIGRNIISMYIIFGEELEYEIISHVILKNNHRQEFRIFKYLSKYLNQYDKKLWINQIDPIIIYEKELKFFNSLKDHYTPLYEANIRLV